MITRRSFFSEMGLGLGGVALSAMLNRDGLAQAGGAGRAGLEAAGREAPLHAQGQECHLACS